MLDLEPMDERRLTLTPVRALGSGGDWSVKPNNAGRG